MMEWKEVELGSLVRRKIGYGIVQPGASPSEGVPLIKVNNIISGLTSVCELDKTTIEIDNKYPRTKLNGGELIISLVGTVGKTAIVPSAFAGCNLVRATGLIDIEEPIIANWVKYYIDSDRGQDYIKKHLNTTVQATLNVKSLVEMPIPITQKCYMEKVVSILSSLDDKIAVNKKICENLEAQAQALFKHWFVDFAPFKDSKFIDSELGLIPEGWRVGTLGDIAEFKRGKTITKSDVKEGLIPVVAGGLEPAYYHNQSNTSSRVITISGSGANAGFTKMYYQPVWASDCSFVDNASTSLLHTAYCYLLINKKKVDALQWGAAQPHVYAKDINKLPLAIAPLDVLNQFEEMISEMFDLIEVNDKETTRLATLRDTLLPKLMSGQIKVNDIEKSL